MTARPLILLLALTGALTLAGCGDTVTQPATDDTGAAVKDGAKAERNRSRSETEQPGKGAEQRKPKARERTAAAALEQLPVKGRAPKTGYDREQFGGDWATVNDCDMRNRILARDLDDIVYDAGSTCEAESGLLSDPYTATRIQLVRGGASEVDIDHVVALGDAWQKGAQQWSYNQRVQFANDPLNLLSADASANRQKSDSDAASWLPPNTPFRCGYVARQIAVKRRYEAWVTGAEKDAMNRVLNACPNQKLPTGRRLRVPVASKPNPTHEPTPKPEDDNAEAQYFENCDAVGAVGLAPLTRGDGIYEHNTHMDRDGDGVACE